MLYHVTTKGRVPSIRKNGLLLNRKRRWNADAYNRLNVVYLFKSRNAAMAWAGKMERYISDIVIVCVRNQPDWHPDVHKDFNNAVDVAIYVDHAIPASHIITIAMKPEDVP